MNTEQLLKELDEIFQKVLKKDAIKLNLDSTANDVDGWTSLTNMLLIKAIEDKYGIHFGFREIIKLRNVGDLCDAIMKKTA
jgi:acyl carrier protein